MDLTKRIPFTANMLSRGISLATAMVAAVGAAPVFAQGDDRSEIEEVIVTGSFIKGTPTDAPSPVQIVDRAELEASGSPTLVELIANLGVSSGTENQTNQFNSNLTTGTANINLRGLGLSRTLVMMNGKRMVSSPFPSNTGEAFVDINTIPALAVERIEVLKDGAAATYGSDAVAGVANFITRSNFEGFEVSGSFQDVDGSDGDREVGVIWGLGGDSYNWVTSLGYKERTELSNFERLDLVSPVADVEAVGLPLFGQSSIGNPGAFLGLNGAGTPTGLITDPNCAAAGGFVNPSTGTCGFVYIPFSNLIEDEERIQLFSEFEYRFSETATFYASLLYSDLDVPNWKSSPSYPPVVAVDPSRYVPPYHPAYAGFIADAGVDPANVAGGALFVGRPIGVTGPSAVGFREQETLRYVGGIEGVFANNISYDVSLMYSEGDGKVGSPDTLNERYTNALRGFGGPDCTLTPSGNVAADAMVAGTGGCLFFNPFASSVPASPNFDPALANDPALLDWMSALVEQANTSDLLVVDAIFTGEAFDLGGGTASWAAGIQYRDETLEVRYNDLGDIDLNPGVITPDGDRPGIFAFLRGGEEGDFDQDTLAVFGELQLPLIDNLDVQLALRYEDYSGDIGSSLDPKVALRWRISDAVALRSSISTTFKAPSLNQTALDSTTLEFIGRDLAFKAVDRVGNPDLDPEEATTFNLGLILTPTEGLELSADYWAFDFSDPVVREDPNALVVQASQSGDPCLSAQISCDGGGNIARITTNYVNGPDIETSGIDFSGRYDFSAFTGLMTLGFDATWINEYDVDAFLGAESFDAVGSLNANSFVRPLQEWKANYFINFSAGGHNIRLVGHFIDEYTDNATELLRGSTLEAFIEENDIDSHNTFDLHYNFTFNQESTTLSASVINLSDEDPPAVRGDLRYDPSTHNPFGQMIKVGFRHRFAF